MRENRALRTIAEGGIAYGVLVSWPCPDMVEFFGHLGFDWIFIDAEHGVIGRESCQELVRACDLTGMTPIVRVPENTPGTILGYLETGVGGVIVPHVNTAADATAMVAAIKYAPEGRRGAGSSTRVANYGLTQTATEYFAAANRQVLVSALIEEAEGVRNLDQILAVEGVDAVGIGPGDLAMSLGLPGQPGHPDVQKLVDAAEARIVKANLLLDAVIGDAAAARRAAARGARLIAVSATALLGGAARGYLQEARRQ